MTCITFPKNDLVAGVTTVDIGDVTYLWSGLVWEAITVPLNANEVQWKGGKSVGYSLDDNEGFKKAALAEVGLADTGQADTETDSQRLEAIKLIAGKYAHTTEERNVPSAHNASAIAIGVSNVEVVLSDAVSKNTTQDNRITVLENSQGASVVGYATQAELYANLAFDEGTIGYVTNDITPSNNGTYRKVGASGTGSWAQASTDLASQAYQNADLALQIAGIIEIQALAKTDNMLDASHNTVIHNTYLDVTGAEIVGLPYYSVSHYIPLRVGDTLFAAPFSLPTSSASVCYYDENLNFVRGVAAPTSIATVSGEHYVRVSFRHDTGFAPALLDVVLSTSEIAAQTAGLRYSTNTAVTYNLSSEDIFPEGKLELSKPLLRNNKGTIQAASEYPLALGFQKVIKCSNNSNTYAYKQDAVGGNSYLAMFFSKHTGGTDTPITECAVSGSVVYNTSLLDVNVGNKFNIDCKNGVTLHVTPVTFPSDHEYFYIGTTEMFPTTTAEIFGLALFKVTSPEISNREIAEAYLEDCMSRVQRVESLNVLKDISNMLGSTYQLGKENLFPDGMFESTYPLIRSGSTVVDCPIKELNDLGFDKAMLQRRTGNDYCYVTDSRFESKRLYCAVLVDNENSSVSLFNTLASVAPLGSLVSVGASVSRDISLGGNLRLYSRIINVPATYNTLYLGTSAIPTWDSYWAGHYIADATGLSTLDDLDKLDAQYLAQIRDKLSRKSLVKSARGLDELAAQVDINASNIEQLLGVNRPTLSISGKYATITGSKFKRVVAAYPNETSVKNSDVFNFNSDYIGELNMYPSSTSGDDVAPIHALGTTLMANHSYLGNFITAGAHGKTSADIGSKYQQGANEYVLVQVAGTELALMRSGTNSDALGTSGTLTYLSGGVTSNNITYTANTSRQMYPCYKDYSMVTLVDNLEIAEVNSNTAYQKSVVFNESYDLLERQSIYDWYATAYDGTRNPDGNSVLNYSGSYSFDIEGNCTQVGNYVATAAFLMSDIMGMQSIRKSTAYYYIPKTLPFTYAGSTVNFSLLESSTTCSGSVGQSSIFFTPEKLDSSAIPSDRWIQINTDGSYFAMGFLPLGDAGLNRAANVVAQTCEIRGDTDKIYPRLLDNDNFTTSVGQSWSFVGYRNVGKPQGIETCSYPVRTDGDDYFYLDYHNVSAIDKITLPVDFIGRKFEVVESRNILVYGSLIASKMSFNVDCIGDYGYVVLRVIK